MKVILKDKKDMNVIKELPYNFTDIEYQITGSQDEIHRDFSVEVLSVKFSKIGQKTFDAYPNLKWIVCRSHGYDNINVELAEKYNVGIVCTNPNTEDVAHWIDKKVKGKRCLVLGGGRIGKRFSEIFDGECELITSKSTYEPTITKDFDTIVVTTSPTSKPVLTQPLLNHFRGGVVSVSRPCCIDHEALLYSLTEGNVTYAEMDMLDPEWREKLTNTGKCRYYKHSAWGNDRTSYTLDYFINLFKEIELCLEDKSENVVLNRKVSFFD